MEQRERKYDITSVGVLYWKSLTLFDCRLEDLEGRTLEQADIKVAEPFRVIFPSGTGYTRTIGVRVV